MNAAISAVIPTHHRAEIVGNAIESIAAQTHPPIELLVVSDVEDEATKRLVADYADRLRFPVTFLRNTNVPGVCGSRNLGAVRAAGDWVAFLDDDDIWFPEFLAQLSNCAMQAKADFALATLREISDAREPRERRAAEGLTVESIFSVPGGLTGSNALFLRNSFLSAGGFDPRVKVFNDWDLFFRLVAMGATYVVDSEPLVEWRQHSGERIGTFSSRRATGLEFFVDRYRPYLPVSLRRELLATAAGMRRRHATGPSERMGATLALARAHGLGGVTSRLIAGKEPRT